MRVLPEPKFSDDPGFAGLGVEAEKAFRRAWYEWSRRAIWSWRRLEDQDFSVHTVVSGAFGRRRKGGARNRAPISWWRLRARMRGR
ncbi:hypothetical protein [Streptomyces sp.]|uniref:hypothetical protein n=1 Tax=Streptomyces sp. TaxID=1931 RepID=UPI0028121909|nr:hypothetical protein [Streptomyces sp.]